jgi:surface protein
MLGGEEFEGCENLTITATDIPNIEGTTFLEYFKDCTSITTIPNLGSWDMSSVTVLSDMFQGATSFNEPSIVNWDVSNVAGAERVFQNTDSFNQPIGVWNTASFSSIKGIFSLQTGFDQDIGTWDISNLIDATNAFVSVTLSTANYDALLIGWAAQNVKPNVTFSGGNSKYSAGAAATARSELTSTPNNWTITDGGQAP